MTYNITNIKQYSVAKVDYRGAAAPKKWIQTLDDLPPPPSFKWSRLTQTMDYRAVGLSMHLLSIKSQPDQINMTVLFLVPCKNRRQWKLLYTGLYTGQVTFEKVPETCHLMARRTFWLVLAILQKKSLFGFSIVSDISNIKNDFFVITLFSNIIYF